MESKTLLTGILSFIAGALLVSIAATTFDKSGDKFDEEFISQMIVHHEGAVEMAKLAEKQAKHDEIKQLSKDIISAQEKEINDMKQWQASWGYTNTSANHNSH
jgi:uncharacterized protein (DUF305 family)